MAALMNRRAVAAPQRSVSVAPAQLPCNVRLQVVVKATDKDSGVRGGLAAAAVAAALLMGQPAVAGTPPATSMPQDRENQRPVQELKNPTQKPIFQTLDNKNKINDEPEGITGGVDKDMYNYVKSDQTDPKLPKVSDSEALLDKARDTVEVSTKTEKGANLDYDVERAD